jgi:hypothetical protein
MNIGEGATLSIYDSEKEALKDFVAVLNTQSKEVDVRTLRRLLQQWRDSGKNTNKLFALEPRLRRVGMQSYVTGTESPRAELISTPHLDSKDPISVAEGRFLSFLLNTHNESLGGPCAECGEYFIKQTRRKEVVYCSQRCGRRVSSRLANRNRRQSERKEQLQLVKQSIEGWKRSKSKLDWKEWVSREKKFSKNWMTRAMKSGEISEPKRA